MTNPRLFTLHRDRDITGVSGTGIVADGCAWPDGTVSIRWRGERPSTVSWNSVEDAEHVHGHGGATRIVWADAEPAHDCPACEADIPHTEHCPTPETHNWGCGCPTDAVQDSGRTVLDTSRTPDNQQDNTARTGGTSQDHGPGQQDTTQDTDTPDVTSHLYRDALLVLLSRLVRGVLLPEERTLLREHVEHLLVSFDRLAAEVEQLDDPGPGAVDEALREQYTTAISRWHRDPEQPLYTQGADAVLAVRDRRMEQLAAGRATWKARAEEMERDRDRSDEAARRALEQRQEMAEERYAWQERGRKAERAADLLAGSHRRAERAEAALDRVRTHLAELRRHQAEAHPSERMRCVMCGTDPADDLARALDGPAAGQVDDSSPTPAPDAHPNTEQQASGTGLLGERPITAEALAQLLSAADVEINHGDYPTWESLAESGTEQYRQAARYVLKRCHVTTKSAPAAGPCEQHAHAPVIGGMCGGCTVYPADMR